MNLLFTSVLLQKPDIDAKEHFLDCEYYRQGCRLNSDKIKLILVTPFRQSYAHLNFVSLL